MVSLHVWELKMTSSKANFGEAHYQVSPPGSQCGWRGKTGKEFYLFPLKLLLLKKFPLCKLGNVSGVKAWHRLCEGLYYLIVMS